MHLIGPGTEGRRFLHADEEVRIADPAIPQKAPLVDDISPFPHRLERRVGSLPLRSTGLVDRDDRSPLGTQLLEHLALELVTAFEEGLQRRWPPSRVERTASLEHVEIRAVLARQEPVQRTRGERRQ